MEQVSQLCDRIRSLKEVATSMHEGAIHTTLIPEIDKVMALPDALAGRSVKDLEAVGRQVREYERTFDRLGYSLLEQLMPATGESPVFKVVRAKDRFRQSLLARVGASIPLDGATVTLDAPVIEALTRYSLSIGTPPVTDGMRALVSRVLFGMPADRLAELSLVLEPQVLDPTRPAYVQHDQLLVLMDLLRGLVDSSMHYCTAAEEQAFLREAAEFVNFEGARLFNRVVVTESPRRVIELIERHVFDKYGPTGESPVKVVDGEDALDGVIARMRDEPNKVFVVRITRIPHQLFQAARSDPAWLSVIGRLFLIDCSARARQSNTTIVYTLFPHVARTLRNVQTSFAGRPANTQLQLRRALERLPAERLSSIRRSIERRLASLSTEGVLHSTVEEIRAQEWTRDNLFELLALKKLRRMVAFLESMAARVEDSALVVPGPDLPQTVAAAWMKYFYGGLPPDTYRATVVPGGGRGALTLVGEFHRESLRDAVDRFREGHLETCRERLRALKETMAIPDSSTDELEAGIKQSQIRALSPTQWQGGGSDTTLADHLARTLKYRAADAAAQVVDRTRQGLERAAFGNVTGGAAALLKKALSKSGFGALHGRLEAVVGEKVGEVDRKVRDKLVPVQRAVQQAQRSLVDLKGRFEEIPVGDAEAVLNAIEQGHFYPTLILPKMSWTYHDVFPEKDFPAASTIRVPQNARKEMDPEALQERLEELRHRYRSFPEVFDLKCRSILLVLNTPHNPTGVVYRRETVLRLLRIASAYDLTVVDDNAYHKIIKSDQKAREGDLCVAQIYEAYRGHFKRPVRLLTVGATTKGLQGAGDRTGLVHANVPEAVEFVERRASAPHQLSLYMTALKLESGLAAKRATREVERLATELLDPKAGGAPWDRLRDLLTAQLKQVGDEDFPVAVFETLLVGYERLLRLRQRGAGVFDLSEAVSELVSALKQLRLERRLRSDVQRRLDQAQAAIRRAEPSLSIIDPQGAFYCCVRLCESGDSRSVQRFLEALATARGIDFTRAGDGYVRLSLGGHIGGDDASYDRLGQAIEVYTHLLHHYWNAFEAVGRDPTRLDSVFQRGDEDPLVTALRDLWPLVDASDGARPAQTGRRAAWPVAPNERGFVYCIEEGRSVADKVFIEIEASCESVDTLLQSRAFRVLYRRLLKKVYRRDARLAMLTTEQVENQYGPLACRAAYHDRQLIDDVFRDLLRTLYREWHGADTVKVLAAQQQAGSHREKVAALHGINRSLNEVLNELMFAFGVPAPAIDASSTFEVGFEVLPRIEAHGELPPYLQRVIGGSVFAGATAALASAPRFTTGAAKRVADYGYGFIRRDNGGGDGRDAPPLAWFRRRLERLPDLARGGDYVCKAVQVGPFKMLLVMHKACFHLVSDELRLFPQIEDVQQKDNLDRMAWDGALFFGTPARLMGESYKTGYIIDERRDGAPLPTAWVALEDATDYVGFLKKSLLTLHNERVKAMGGMPVHGAMITITFKNGLRKTLVFSADSGAGKSETITAMMEQMSTGGRLAAHLERIDILAGDMLSLWRGADEQVYAFGTETGDFMRLTDITATWQERFGDLLNRGSYSNLDHPKNPRVTIPGICDRLKVLRPTRVNGFFYINNYEAPSNGAVEVVEDPHKVLKHILVRGLRKNKGTSGDQPSLRAGLEFCGRTDLVARFRYELDSLLDWSPATIDGRARTCLGFRDGAQDVYAALEVVRLAFKGQRLRLPESDETVTIQGVDHDVMRNRFVLKCDGGRRVALDREAYDQIYEPLVSTFCGNPFVDPHGMDRTLDIFAETMQRARVHTGVIRTQLARAGYEFSGPAAAAEDVVDFLLEDEEVSARYQRNKDKVHRAIERFYAGTVERGTNLPVELEGYNLLRLEEHESTHVEFRDLEGRPFTVPTPYYHYQPPPSEEDREPFRPAIVRPEHRESIADICGNSDYDMPLEELEVELERDYQSIRYWNDVEELTYQVLLLHGVISLGSSEAELARFPLEVRKARHIAERIQRARPPAVGGDEAPLRRRRRSDRLR